ncbi:MAG: diphosphomevalonate decarboxylase [Pelolinea sp.]|nr:diphosphomevalonate decarboxylase [Pelolinea sp.]
MKTSTVLSHPNIAFIKYWGNRDNALRIPANGSISMNLASLETRTSVEANPEFQSDSLTLNGRKETGTALVRVQAFMDLLREMSGNPYFARVSSENNFPQSTGIASSASGFAALAAAGSKAFGLDLSEKELSMLARRGSGSASRSIPDGFVEWHAGKKDADSYAESIAPAEHWELWDCVAVVTDQPKKTGSTEGHLLAGTSPLQAARVQDAPRRLEICRNAILKKNFEALADIIELDSNLMHGVMMTSTPPLMYWSPKSLKIMQEVAKWRKKGIPAAYTLDAGPNVHVICTKEYADRVRARLEKIPGVARVLISGVGSGVQVLL